MDGSTPGDALRERRRSASVRLYGLDTAVAAATSGARVAGLDLDMLQEVVELTRAALGAEGAGVNLLVDDQQVTLASTSPLGPPLSRDSSLCSVMLARHEDADLFEVRDLSTEPGLMDNPFVDGRLAALRFYAAAPLVGRHGLALGTLCAWSTTPQSLDDQQRGTLRQFGRAVVNLLDEHRRALVADSRGAMRPRRSPGPQSPGQLGADGRPLGRGDRVDDGVA